MATIPANWEVAEQLRQMAELLEQQGANPYRVNAYRRGADTVAGLDQDIKRLAEQRGIDHLVSLPNIGQSIARAVFEIAVTGRWGQLDRLRGELDAVTLFQTVPGIGPELARRVHDQLHIDSLEALEAAAHDGRLEAVGGIGRRRAAAIRAALGERLRRRRTYRPRPAADDPDVGQLLGIDQEYRDRAAAGALPTIAPKRFNPQGAAWLPVLHAERGRRHFTALYSNTALAHKLGRTRDWVVIYWYDDHDTEGQCTVVTETQGPLSGRRVVRGRERQCRDFYDRQLQHSRTPFNGDA